MTNVQENPELTKAKKRIADLNNRYDRLLELNQTHHYTFMILVDGKLARNPDQDRYLRMLLEIRNEKHKLWLRVRELSPRYMMNVNNGIQSVVSLTKSDMFHLTSPTL